jgi:hypothetical protein
MCRQIQKKVFARLLYFLHNGLYIFFLMQKDECVGIVNVFFDIEKIIIVNRKINIYI